MIHLLLYISNFLGRNANIACRATVINFKKLQMNSFKYTALGTGHAAC